MNKREREKLERQQKKEREMQVYNYWDEASAFYENLEYRRYTKVEVPEDAFYELSYRTYVCGGCNDPDELGAVLLTAKEVQKWLDMNYLHWQGIQLDADGKAHRIIDDVHHDGMREEVSIRDTRITLPKFDTSPRIVQLCKELREAEKAAIEDEKQRKKEERAARKAEKDRKEYEKLKAQFEETNDQT